MSNHFQLPPPPDQVGTIVIVLNDVISNQTGLPVNFKSCEYRTDLLASSKPVGQIGGDLSVYLTTEQLTDLTTIMDAVRAKMKADLNLP